MAAASVALTLALGATVLPATAPSASADDLKDRQRSVEKKIKGAHSDLESSSSALKKASARLASAKKQLDVAKAQLATARGRLEVAQERDAAMQAELEAAEAALAQAEAELLVGQQQRDTQRQVVAQTVADIYMDGDPELMAFSSLLDSASPEDLTRNDEVRDIVVGRETRAYDELSATEVLLTVQEEQVELARDDVALKREEAAARLVERQAIEAEKAAARESVRSLVGERAEARVTARKARAKDVAKLKVLERQQARIKEMLRKRALAALRRKRANAPVARDSGGLLSYPVDTYVTSPFGWRTHPIYHYWGLHDGVDFGGGCGVPLKAAADGRVVASYWSAVYGRRLVVDHGVMGGKHIATIYNHASSYGVGVGARVSRGQVIGRQGDTGWSTACHLHFTVMANGNAVDPMNWL